MRKFPKTMATQHPDNAKAHSFSKNAFVNTQEEVEECYLAFSQLQCQEFMWDWEGKHVDEGVMDKLMENYYDYFSKNQIGADIFLTFRIPNIWVEKGYRIARAFANLIAANDLMEEMKLHSPPLFELILPMTTSAEKLFWLRSKYSEIVKAFEFIKPPGPEDISLIPLVEETHLMLNAHVLLDEYLSLCTRSAFKKYDVEYLRPFIARSDPALNSGLIPSVISAKAALSRFAEFTERTSVLTFPIIGVGSLPFRGHLSPENIKPFEKDYAGVRTVTIQSAFRADFPEENVKKGISSLNSGLSSKARVFDKGELNQIQKLNDLFSTPYKKTIENLEIINDISKSVPSRRERKLHIGLFGYSRQVGKKHMPRAIPFTCALYSLGVPPEFIGTGRGLQEAQKHNLLDFLQDIYLGLKPDLIAAGRYLNKDNLQELAKNSKTWKNVVEDVELTEKLLSLELGPIDHEHKIHKNLTSNIRLLIDAKKNISSELVRAAEIRNSLG